MSDLLSTRPESPNRKSPNHQCRTNPSSAEAAYKTYGRITEFLKEKGLLKSEADWARYMPMWEEYRNDPTTTPEAELVTYIYLPVPGN